MDNTDVENITIPKFSGLTTEDPSTFLGSFKSYSLDNLDTKEADGRKVAAFHLKLSGPALIWYQSLQPEAGEDKNWALVEKQFLDKYISLKNNPVLLAESELFQQLSLSPTQRLEEYHSLLVEQGTTAREDRQGHTTAEVRCRPASAAGLLCTCPWPSRSPDSPHQSLDK